jgi:hypothetical protein
MRRLAALPLFCSLLVVGCNQNTSLTNLGFTGYALDSAGTSLVKLNLVNGAPIGTPAAISGLVSGDSVVAIDFDPSSGLLYGLSNNRRLYTFNVATGVATQVGSAQLPALTGNISGMDFIPSNGQLRVVTDGGSNIRVNAATNTVIATDTSLTRAAGDPNGAAPIITDIAYDNNFNGTGTTTCYALDNAGPSLARIGAAGGSPSAAIAGTVATLFSAPGAVASPSGLDVSSQTNTIYMVISGGTAQGLYSWNASTGSTTLLSSVSYRDIAVQP